MILDCLVEMRRTRSRAVREVANQRQMREAGPNICPGPGLWESKTGVEVRSSPKSPEAQGTGVLHFIKLLWCCPNDER